MKLKLYTLDYSPQPNKNMKRILARATKTAYVKCYVWSLLKKLSLLYLFAFVVTCSYATETEPEMGWVKLSFDINEVGKPINIRVIDSKPKKIYDRSAISALKKWKYKPKVVDGVAVIQENLAVQLDFVLEERSEQ